jgi:hypothetical protein
MRFGRGRTASRLEKVNRSRADGRSVELERDGKDLLLTKDSYGQQKT